ncbi:hypothetical protein JHK82_018861 [Glycine max]|nr:hypothetical protein JHK85_019304 [Glycine max]KAG5038042.1 hypothetical protein JHK86_018882 [Glycine max]KAG5143166.1 hypothetical protein JHK82_018861 [Glycine max]
MDEGCDVIVLGTGLKECILSGLLSVDGLKVLNMDKNDYYGGESTSLNVIQMLDVLINCFACALVQVHKVPTNNMEALKSPLMGLFEKCRARKFFIYVQNYNESDPKTHEGMDLTRVNTKEFIVYMYTCFLVVFIIYADFNVSSSAFALPSYTA